jgi:hypothetical protein
VHLVLVITGNKETVVEAAVVTCKVAVGVMVKGMVQVTLVETMVVHRTVEVVTITAVMVAMLRVVTLATWVVVPMTGGINKYCVTFHLLHIINQFYLGYVHVVSILVTYLM